MSRTSETDGADGTIPRCKSITMGSKSSPCPAYKGDLVTDLDLDADLLSDFHMGSMKEVMEHEGIECDPATECVVYAGENNLASRVSSLLDDSVYALACVLSIDGKYEKGDEKGLVFQDFSQHIHYELPIPAVMDHASYAESVADLAKELSNVESYNNTQWLDTVIEDYDFSETNGLLRDLEMGATVTSVDVHVTFCILKDENSENDMTHAKWEAKHGSVHRMKRQRTG